jgi:hypothetical protein
MLLCFCRSLHEVASDDAHFIHARKTETLPAAVGVFVLKSRARLLHLFYAPRVSCAVGTLFLQNYVCSQKLAGDIIVHVAADGELVTNYKRTTNTTAAPLKKRTAVFFYLKSDYSSCSSKQHIRRK